MGKLKDHTRADIITLLQVGTELNDGYRSGVGLGSPSRLVAWIGRLEKLLLDAPGASDAMQIDEGLFVLRKLGAGGAAVQANLTKILSALNRLIGNGSFLPTIVDDETFARFLRAARLEDQNLVRGEWIDVNTVLARETIEAAEGQRCLARLLDEKLGRISTLDKVKLDQNRVDSAIADLDPHSTPAPSARASRASYEKFLKDPTRDTTGLGYSGVVCNNLRIALDGVGYRRYWEHPYDFDEQLEHVVREFQHAQGHRNQDGRVGPGTRALLIDALLANDFDWSRMQSVFMYDVALSFAGDDRVHAEALAACLKAHGVKVFYDAYEQAELWGKDLYVHLHNIYSQRARFCVMFVSTRYAAKVWTTHERRAAQEHALQAADHEYILPIRLDDTKVPGLASTIGYVDIGMGIDGICELLVKKLRA